MMTFALLLGLTSQSEKSMPIEPSSLTTIQQSYTPVKVEVIKSASGWQLVRGGKPYFIRGVGGTGRMDDLVRSGGNSMRTWGTERAGIELEEANQRGLTIQLGIWLGHKEYFDFKNVAQVEEQFQKCRNDILAFRNHPALLMWAFGNEMENGQDIPETWQAIEQIAKYSKKVDPYHPTSTVIADFNESKIQNIIKYAPSIDVLGINSYGGVRDLAVRLKKAGWTKPYTVTEFGPNGPWELPKTEWKAGFEQTSTEKASQYRAAYENTIYGQPGWCLGSFAFLWGDKQEETPTWFGMFLPSVERTEAVDVATKFWTGKEPENRCPRISAFETSLRGKVINKGDTFSASVSATDPDGDKLTYVWQVYSESRDKRFDGQGEDKPKLISGPWDVVGGNKCELKFPNFTGSYRLYVKVLDGKGNAAVANHPFRVQ
jgi:hypothetical protein